MNVRDEERQGAQETARLKREAREAKRSRAIQLAAEGLTPWVIGARLRVDGATVAEWLRAAGVRYATRAGRGGLVPADAPPC